MTENIVDLALTLAALLLFVTFGVSGVMFFAEAIDKLGGIAG